MKLAISLLLFCLYFSTAQAADAPYKFTTVDLSVTSNGVTEILRLVDLNNAGELIGHHRLGTSYHVTKNRRTITEIDCGGDSSTDVSAINNLSQIVGTCYDSTGINGFIHSRRNGSYTFLRYPGSIHTVAYGINDLGHVVGQYASDNQGRSSSHAFIYKDGVYTTIDAPDPEQMHGALYAINKHGQAIGDYEHHVFSEVDTNTYDNVIPFLYDNGSFSLIDYPGGVSPSPCCEGDTFIHDINNLTQIIGAAYDSAGKLVLFLHDDNQYFKLTGSPENFNLNGVTGINDKGEIVGTYFERVPCATCLGGFRPIPHSFIAKPRR